MLGQSQTCRQLPLALQKESGIAPMSILKPKHPFTFRKHSPKRKPEFTKIYQEVGTFTVWGMGERRFSVTLCGIKRDMAGHVPETYSQPALFTALCSLLFVGLVYQQPSLLYARNLPHIFLLASLNTSDTEKGWVSFQLGKQTYAAC